MTYQLIVKNMVAQDIITKIISLPKRSSFHRKFSMFDLLDGSTEIRFSVDSLSVNVEDMEKKLNEAVLSPNSNIVSWKKLD